MPKTIFQQYKFKAKPFIKWAGGKGQLLQQLEEQLPPNLYSDNFTYIEPFVGGGAMLFFMLQKFPNIRKAVINDINKNLTDAYKTIKYDAENLIANLKRIEKEYLAISSDDKRKEYYLVMRQCFNEEQMNRVDKTTLLLFLNRTCFNGLYRENSKGKFNVPFGKYSNPTICNEELIYSDNELLNQFDVQIFNGDFNKTEKELSCDHLNFFYFDPPYRPLSATSSFNSYVKEEFNDKEQKRLANFCHKISQRNNVLWMLNNSDCSAKNPDDKFFENIYAGFNINRVYAVRSINSNPSKRGKLTELLVTNFSTTNNRNIKSKIDNYAHQRTI